MSNLPKVSVIIPTHNRASLMREAVASVQAQTFTDWELLIVDDGSTDETPDVAKALCERDARVRYLRQDNQGVAEARNMAIQAARGVFIAFLDDDDRWIPSKLATQFAFMQSHPRIGLTYTRYWFTGGSKPYSICYPQQLCTTYDELIEENFIGTSTVMVRRDVFDAAGRFNPAYQPVEDYAVWLRVTQQFPFAGIDAPLAVYTHRPQIPHLTRNRVKVQRSTLAVLSQLPIGDSWRSSRAQRRRQLAVVHYRLGRLHWDDGAYWKSAQQFSLALATHPLVRVFVRTESESGVKLMAQVFKSYLAVPWCLVQGVLHAGS